MSRRTGIKPALQVESSSESETTNGSSGVELQFPEGYLEKD